ncbi:terpenoid cyclases/Protein prenyltransferase [Thozetella sp. PMI_491]|nr:terpenoid cyclases/Protein prenyltransferase [Thozetella sp. PMI_491]
MIPDLFTQFPLVRDELETATSIAQDETVEACQPFLAGEDQLFDYNEHGVPRLLREKHIAFLHNSLKALPGRFVAADASRPWFLYWCLEGLALLGEDVTGYRESAAATARSMQNASGGFGGGGKQLSHLATTYAVVLSLALVGGEEAFEVVDRRAMWRWLCSLKQPDGGFQVCLGGEEDIRGVFCAAVVIALLNLPLDLAPDSPAYDANQPGNLFTGIGEYVHRCQTFEGGISPQPGAEAHGAYAFCALGVLSILDIPSRIIPRYLDVPRLISWLSSRQYAPEGGFSGRTNKLVDGCYSHWVGACFPLVEVALDKPSDSNIANLPTASESLFHREGLIRYILCCGQDQTKRGGLRDKPGR